MKKRKLVIFVLLPLVLLFVYTAIIVYSGQIRTNELIDYVSKVERSGITPLDLPPGWIDELLLVEDPGFYTHNGIDLGSPGAGLTTLTQGLVKIHYFEKFKPGLAKYKQSILALVLDSKMSKDSQLILILNTIRLGYLNGEEILGFPKASEMYFGKSFGGLDHDEYLSLVAMIIGPTQFNVAKNPKANADRVARLEKLLAGECEPAGLTDIYYSDCG